MHQPCQCGIAGVEKCGLVMGRINNPVILNISSGHSYVACRGWFRDTKQYSKVEVLETPSYFFVIGVLVRRIGF